MEKKRAYISVYDKTGLAEFCRYLVEYGYELVASELSYGALTEAGIPAREEGRFAAFSEAAAGEKASLFVVNLYPFKEDMEKGLSFEEAAPHIDADGVALLTAAAKNFMNTVAVCDPADYDRLLCDLAAGAIPEDERKYFMYKAFGYAASYNALVSQYLSRQVKSSYPETLTVTYEKSQEMRYGENPHQRAAVYREPLLKEGSLARAKQLAGPALTYNSVGDANAALELVKEFEEPAVVSCKHRTVSAAAAGEDLYVALKRMAENDPLGLKGAIVAFNGVVDARVAAELKKYRAEVALAVGFTPEAMAELRFSENLVLLEMPGIRSKVQFSTYDLTKIYGGLLVQTYDTALCGELECVTERRPTDAEVRALIFNFKVVKHALSSAVVIGSEGATYGIGTGQVGRRLAFSAARSIAGAKTKGAVLASEASIPGAAFAEECHKAGITAVVCSEEPDKATLDALNLYRIAALVSSERHFKN